MKTPLKALREHLSVKKCLLAGVLSLGMAGAGCASNESGFIEQPIYPANKRQSRVLDIQAYRDGTHIRFTNSTATAIPACTMWVNSWFSKQIPGVGIGETVSYDLYEFLDQYGDSFRAGGFFASDRPAKVVLLQLEMNNEIVGLIVVGEDQ